MADKGAINILNQIDSLNDYGDARFTSIFYKKLRCHYESDKSNIKKYLSWSNFRN